MKNCLIVIAVLFGCFVIAVILFFGLNTNWGRGFAGGEALMVGQWTNYDDPSLMGLEVTIIPNEIVIFALNQKTMKMESYKETGRWRSHAFYCDSHTDSPAEVQVASELPNEDLQLNLKYFSPSLPDQALCVLKRRNPTVYHPYPVYAPGQTVTYPPPKGLIRPGMLECDLQTLPWRPDHVQLPDSVVDARPPQTLSDGTQIPQPPDPLDNPPQNTVYTYHSDRADAPQLLVTVYHGRVIQVDGGAEETGDIPYAQPPPPNSSETPKDDNSSWAGWLFDLLFSK
jgi:hypothetical protein